MKFAIVLIVACLCVSFISAKSVKPVEKTWGDVNAEEFGSETVIKHTDTKLTSYTFQFPGVPNEYPIVGMKLIDRNPTTKVKIVEGKLGDKQLTLKLTAEEHDIDVDLIFYHKP